MSGVTRIGPAGWDYKDWSGVVYPFPREKGFDPLAYLSGFFDTVEINSTFYRPPGERAARSWVARVADNPHFRFTAKLYRVFTHERGKATNEDEVAYRAGIEPLASEGVLGAVLVQFPWSYKNDADARTYLKRLVSRFREYPLVVELRHASWNLPAFYDWLEEQGVGFCNIDQPLFARSIKPSTHATSAVGYVRLHGRNYQNWFKEAAGAAERYDYLYSAEELLPWVDNIKKVTASARDTYVVTNNHFLGKAVVNALELKSVLSGRKVDAPPPLLAAYPRLKEIADVD
jgi:uncharacterized protein YecE (DUF72 family)